MTDTAPAAEDQRLLYLKSLVGREFSDSPSPFGRWLKGKVVAVERGSLTFEFVVREDMSNIAGGLHGGVVAAICDDLIGATVFSAGIFSAWVSLNLSVTYLRGARTGDVVQARTAVVSEGRRVASLECTLSDAAGTPLARASSQLMNVGA